ncbi:MAG: HD domain-containing protein [Pseudomonadota bacterium]|nr:HD domain-containing protein [Pseudomonadota bacterium]
MPFDTSIIRSRSRQIFLAFFALASLLPILIAIYVTRHYVLPLLTPEEMERLAFTFQLGASAMLFFPLLSFFLMFRWLNSLENITTEIVSKTQAVASREEDFADQKIDETNDYADSVAPPRPEENEIQTLIRSFNTIFQTAADQLAERNHIKDLLARLIGISANLTSELDFDRLFPLIIGKVTEAMEAERTSLYVVDWDREELWTMVAEGVRQIRLPLGQGISGRVALTARVINVPDAWELPYFDRSFDEMNNFRTRSVLCVPIRGRFGKTIGVLQVINKLGKDRFDGEDETFLRGLASQVGIALENSLLVDELKLSFEASIKTLSATVDSRHPITAGHSERVTEYALMIARDMKLGQEDQEAIKYAAILHDIGKIGIRDAVLLKVGRFTPEEWEEMKTHPRKTREILEQFRFPQRLRLVPEIASDHHERIDGTGYTEGLTGNQIPLGARIIAVADVFDALTSKRDYPKYTPEKTLDNDPMPLPQVIELLKSEAGSHFDPQIVTSLLNCLPEILRRHRGVHFPPEYVDALSPMPQTPSPSETAVR